MDPRHGDRGAPALDDERFRVVFERTSGPLLSYLMHVTGDRALADDVFQESYIRLLQSGPAELTDEKLKSYLFVTATNLLRDHWRREKRRSTWEAGQGGAPTTGSAEENVSLRMTLEAALTGLSPQQRSLVWLAYAEGYEHREIAHMLGLKEKSIRVLLYRARAKMSTILRAEGIQKEEL